MRKITKLLLPAFIFAMAVVFAAGCEDNSANLTSGVLTIRPNGGTIVKGQERIDVEVGSSILSVLDDVELEYEGHTYVWTDRAGNVITEDLLMTGKGYTVVAEWSTGSYDLIFDAKGGKVSGVEGNKLSVDYGASLLEIVQNVTAQKDGFEFNGWTKSDGSEITAEDTMGVSTTVVASFTPMKYTVTLNANGGSIEGDTSFNLECGSAPTFADPTKENYAFAGWYLDEDCTIAWDGVVPYEGCNLYANYALDKFGVVEFYDEDGTLLSAQTVEYGKTFVVPSDFLGVYETVEWYTEGFAAWYDYSGEVVMDRDDKSVLKLYAEVYIDAYDFAQCDKNGKYGSSYSGEFAGWHLSGRATKNIPTEALGGTAAVNGYGFFRYTSENPFIDTVKFPAYHNGSPVISLASIVNQTTDVHSVVIPNTYRFFAASAFKDNKGLSSFVFEEGSTAETLPVGFLTGNALITSVVLPDSVTTLTSASTAYLDTQGVFAGCIGLTSVVMNGVTYIGDGAFYGCSLLTGELTMNDVTYIGVEAFTNTGSDLTLNVGLAEEYTIARLAFYACGAKEMNFSGLSDMKDCTLAIADSISNTYLVPGKYGNDFYPFFYQCNNLQTVTFDSATTRVGNYAFYGLGVQNIIFEADEVTFGKGVFFRSTYTKFTTFSVMTAIPDNAFAYSENLEEIKLSNSTVSIGEEAFLNCAKLIEVAIPARVETLPASAFVGCTILYENQSISINKSNPNFTSVEDENTGKIKYILSNGGKTLAIDFEGSVENKVFPSGLEVIPAAYFGTSDAPNETIVTLYIPASVKLIESKAFQYCTALTTIVYERGTQLVEIQGQAFDHCSSLQYAYYDQESTTTFMVPASVKYLLTATGTDTTVEENFDSSTKALSSVFSYCNISEVVFEEGTQIQYIGNDAFYYQNTGLTSVSFGNSGSNPGLKIGEAAFRNTGNTANGNPITFPAYAKVIMGYNAISWSQVYFAEDAQVEELYQTFINATLTNEVVIPASVKHLTGSSTSGTFSNAKFAGLVFENPANVETIGDYCFGGFTFSTTGKTLDLSAFSNVANVGTNLFRGSSSTIADFKLILPVEWFDGTNNTILSSSSSYFKNTTVELSNPNGVEYSIGTAFKSFSKVTSLTLPEGLVKVDDQAFYGLSAITSLILPNSVTEIGASAFYGCSKLTKLTIPANVISLGDAVFKSCTSLTGVTFEGNITSIPSNAFYGCTKLTSFTVPEGVLSVGDNAFYNCSALTTVVFPSTCAEAGLAVFYGCKALKNVNLGGVETVGNNFFYNCSVLASLTLPDTLKNIGDKFLYGCAKLTEITIPANVETVGASAFAGLPGRVVNFANEAGTEAMLSVGEMAFQNCSLPMAATNGGFSIYKSGEETVLTFYSGTDLEVAIPAGVTVLDAQVFKNVKVTSLTFPEGFKAIMDGTSSSYASLGASITSVSFAEQGAEDVLYIGKYAFYQMPITSLTLPTGGTVYIGNYSFATASSTVMNFSWTVTSNITYIGQYAFNKQTKVVTSFDATPRAEGKELTIDSNAFKTNESMSPVLVLPEGTVKVGGTSFSECYSLTSVTLPSTLLAIDSSAFKSDKNITEVTIGTPENGNACVSIGASAFAACTSLRTITIYGDNMVKNGGTGTSSYCVYQCSNVTIRVASQELVDAYSLDMTATSNPYKWAYAKSVVTFAVIE